jgi:hypothetical protein
MKLSSYTDLELLEMYAPVLRFSGGEKFFPMNVEDYMAGNTRLIQVDKKGRREISKEWENEPDVSWRLKKLGRAKGNAHLRFLARDFRLDTMPRIFLTAIVTLLVVIIIWGIVQIGTDYAFMRSNVADIIKMSLLGILIVIWPFIDADGKAHFGLVLNLFGIFFFGTVFAIGVGLLGIGILAGVWVTYFVFRSAVTGTEQYIPREHLPRLHRKNLFLIALVSALLGGTISWLGFGQEWFSAGFLNLPVITTFSAILFYIFLVNGEALEMKRTSASLRPKEFKYIYFLLVSLILIAGILWLGSFRGLVSESSVYVAAISISGVSLLWYALDPLSIVKPGLLREENQRQPVFGWDGRILAFITIAFLVYTLFSLSLYFVKDWQVNNIIFAVILHFLVSAFGLLVTIGILGESVVSYYLDIRSGLYNTDALKAWRKVQSLLKARLASAEKGRNRRYWYYGRVCREDDWMILQYNYFYAFNDYRSTAGGMNNHEGDWECVHVFVREGGTECHCSDKPHVKPFGVAYSQHYHGAFQFWENVARAKKRNKEETCHALAYVALGSHANYAKPEIYPLSKQVSGFTQRLVAGMESFIQLFRSKSRLVEEYARMMENALKDFEVNKRKLIAQGGFAGGGLQEYAGGDGLRIGYGFDPRLDIYDEEFKAVIDLPPGIPRRESNFNGKPADPKVDFFDDWAFDVITEDTDWVKFKGLWGRNARIEGESGPQGPRWNGDEVRIRWGGRDQELSGSERKGYFLEWLDVLLLDMVQDENQPTMLRKQALMELTRGSRQDTERQGRE